MKTILIATHNLDKFEIVKKMFCLMGLQVFRFMSLRDLDINISPLEDGTTVEERARQKALFYLDEVDKTDSNAITAIVGVDDGVHLLRQEIITPNLKMFAADIIGGNLLKLGERVDLLQGFAVHILQSDLVLTCTTHIPFVYVRNNTNTQILENRYPLKQVLARVETEIPIAEVSTKEIAEYYVQHSHDSLSELIYAIKAINTTSYTLHTVSH